MIEFVDPFGRPTIIEMTITLYNQRAGFVIRKERQSIYESWDLETLDAVIDQLIKVKQQLKDVNNDKEI